MYSTLHATAQGVDGRGATTTTVRMSPRSEYLVTPLYVEGGDGYQALNVATHVSASPSLRERLSASCQSQVIHNTWKHEWHSVGYL